MSRKRRGLRPEEAVLWDRVAEGARPMHPARRRGQTADEKPAPFLGAPAEPSPPSIPRFRIGEAAPERGSRHLIQPGIAERVAGQPLRMDRKAFTRMARGKLKPEARIDLHGMTLAEAHPELIRFLLRAHAQGARLVLVVTGKGRDRDAPGPIPAPRGILRHQVPVWLAQPPLAGLVLQIAEAHQRHGGGGAYYIYLRRSPGRP